VLNDQVRHVQEAKGKGKLEDLFQAEDVWTVQ
jgi:hypothetical protein